jgi:hypothetical protein
MKYTSIALSALALLSGCAGTKVTQTQVATGEMNPKAIYIRPFAVGEFKGSHGSEGYRVLRESQAPREFATILKEELEKIAPTIVLADDEVAPTGWLVEGELQVVNAGSPTGRAFLGHAGVGRSGILTHVVIKDVDGHHVADGKSGRSNTVYEFDVAGGSRLNGHVGSVKASGLGYAPAFDYRNTAETIYHALTPDANRYGVRTALTIQR